MPTRTEAYVAHRADLPIALSDITLSDPGPGELLVKLVAASVCHTDFKTASGAFFLKPPLILGHEAAGRVVKTGPGATLFSPGDAIILSYASCGVCRPCLTGKNPYCDRLEELNFSGLRGDGTAPAADEEGNELKGFFFGHSSMSRMFLARETSAVKVDVSDADLKICASLGCGIQTGAGAILNVLRPQPGSRIAIFGAGAVGGTAAMAACLSSPEQVIMINRSEDKLNLLPDGVGTHIIASQDLKRGGIAEQLMKITGGRGVDYALDCVGNSDLLDEAQQALSKCGTICQVGGVDGFASIHIEAHLVRGSTYRGTHQGDSVSRSFIPLMIDLWKQGKFPFDKLLTFYNFDELDKVTQDLKEGKIVKPVLVA